MEKAFGMSFADAGDACLDPDLKTDQVSSSIKNALECVSEKNPGANEAHQCCNRLDHRKHPLRTPAKTKRRGTPHSQKDFGRQNRNRRRPRIPRNRMCQIRATTAALPCARSVREYTAPTATTCSPSQGSPHFRRVPVAVSLQLGAQGGVHRNALPKRLDIGMHPAEW